MALGCAGLFYDALLVYKATLLIVLTWGSYSRLLTQKFNLSTIKLNLHYLLLFVYIGKICNMKAVPIMMVEL